MDGWRAGKRRRDRADTDELSTPYTLRALRAFALSCERARWAVPLCIGRKETREGFDAQPCATRSLSIRSRWRSSNSRRAPSHTAPTVPKPVPAVIRNIIRIW